MRWNEPTADPLVQPDTPGDEVEAQFATHAPLRRGRLGPLQAGGIVIVALIVVSLGALVVIEMLFRAA